MARTTDVRLVGGRYRPVRLLGRGGMSEVWLSQDERLGREVALKFLHPGPGLTADFERETGILAGLRHPNIVTVYDAGQEDGRHYIVMEHVEGISLRDRLQRDGLLSAGEAARVGAALSAALAYAHGRGVLHNDVKPENVLLDADGEARLTDFGAATVTGATLDADGAAQVMGTIAYVAPEVLQGAFPGAASDIYALATTLYESVAGRLPYEGRSNAALAGQKVSQPPATLAAVLPGVPPVLESFINRGLSMEPSERPDAAAFHRGLLPVATREKPAGPVPVGTSAAGKPRRRQTQRLVQEDGSGGRRRGRPGLLVLGGLVGAGLIAAGAVALTNDDDPGTPDGSGTETISGTEPDGATSTVEATATPKPAAPTQGNGGGNGRGNDNGNREGGNGNGNGNGNDDDDDD